MIFNPCSGQKELKETNKPPETAKIFKEDAAAEVLFGGNDEDKESRKDEVKETYIDSVFEEEKESEKEIK